MIKSSDKPNIIAIASLRERLKIAQDKAQSSGMADISATMLECFELVDFLSKTQSYTLFKGKVIFYIETTKKSGMFINVRVHHEVMSKGRMRGRRLDVLFVDSLVETAKTIRVGDIIACEGSLGRGGRGTILLAWNLEILKRGEPADGNAVA